MTIKNFIKRIEKRLGKVEYLDAVGVLELYANGKRISIPTTWIADSEFVKHVESITVRYLTA